MSKNKGRKFETEFVKTINSGAFFNDSDAKSDTNMLEIKYTEKKSFLKIKNWVGTKTQ